jgi:glutamyl-Q tRNA(Asp) synthetase
VLRFAPSPNGRLHLGHAYSALLNARLAERMGGRFLLRIEDIDTTRCTDALTEAMLEDLRWLGLRWEEPVRRQSQHWEDYRAAAQTLRQHGLLYPCFCSRSYIAARSEGTDPDGAPLYPGTCRALPEAEAQARIAQGEPHAWRLHMARAMAVATGPLVYTRLHLPEMTEEPVPCHPARWGDAVLVRKETPTSYHLSVVVDDALQGITHIVRGADLEAATDVHVLLQTLLGLPTPYYHHHPLLTDEAGEKLSKSRGSKALSDVRRCGTALQDVQSVLRALLPW